LTTRRTAFPDALTEWKTHLYKIEKGRFDQKKEELGHHVLLLL
jgi:hypothetical protein